MKKELKEIVEKNDIKALRSYIEDDKNLDYLFPKKLGDYSLSLSPLVYCLANEQYELADIILRRSNTLFIEDSINKCSKDSLNIIFFACVKSEDLQDMLYSHMDDSNKIAFSKYVLKYIDSSDYKNNGKNGGLDKFLLPKDRIDRIIKNDEHDNLIDFINKNPNFFKYQKENYLLKTIENQSVFCFDILKEHLKSIKSLAARNDANKTNKVKPF